MKPILLSLLAFAARAAALDITTTDGTRFTDCTSLRVQREELCFVHSTGSAHILAFKLQPALQGRYFSAATVEASRVRAKSEDDARDHKRESDAMTAAAMAAAQRQQREAEGKAAAEAAQVKAAAKAELEAERTIVQRGVRREKQLEAKYAAALREDKMRTFMVTMDSLSPTGFLGHSTDGKPLHVIGDLGLTQGQSVNCYFERAATAYEYTTVGGGRTRVENWIARERSCPDVWVMEQAEKAGPWPASLRAIREDAIARFQRMIEASAPAAAAPAAKPAPAVEMVLAVVGNADNAYAAFTPEGKAVFVELPPGVALPKNGTTVKVRLRPTGRKTTIDFPSGAKEADGYQLAP